MSMQILQVLLFAHLFYLLSLMLPLLGNRLAVATHKHALAQEFFKRPQRPSFVTSTFVATHHADTKRRPKGRAPCLDLYRRPSLTMAVMVLSFGMIGSYEVTCLNGIE